MKSWVFLLAAFALPLPLALVTTMATAFVLGIIFRYRGDIFLPHFVGFLVAAVAFVALAASSLALAVLELKRSQEQAVGTPMSSLAIGGVSLLILPAVIWFVYQLTHETVFYMYMVVGILLVLALPCAWMGVAWNRWWFDAGEAQRRQAEAAAHLGLPVEKVVDLGDGVKLELVLIPAGRFRMGGQASEHDDLGFGHEWVLITKSFFIGKHEVTQEVWTKVMGTNPSKFEGAQNPVENVSWDDCQEFLNKLNALGKEPGVLRLPTEAEWEWACRAGTRTRFCFGDEESGLVEYGWYDDNSGKTTHPVGAKKPNAWGLYDCHGNVWEWCGGWYEDYVRGWWSKADRTGPVTGDCRVLRGGSWSHHSRSCRSAYRERIGPDIRGVIYGLRLVVSSSRTP